MPDDVTGSQTASGAAAPGTPGPPASPSQAPAAAPTTAAAPAAPGQAGLPAQGAEPASGPQDPREQQGAAYWHRQFSEKEKETNTLRSQLEQMAQGLGEEEEVAAATQAPVVAQQPPPVQAAPVVPAQAAPAQGTERLPATMEEARMQADAYVAGQVRAEVDQARANARKWVGQIPDGWDRPVGEADVEATAAKAQKDAETSHRQRANAWLWDQSQRIGQAPPKPPTQPPPQQQFVTREELERVQTRTLTIHRMADAAMAHAANVIPADILDGTVTINNVPVRRRDAIRDLMVNFAAKSRKPAEAFDPMAALYSLDRNAHNAVIVAREFKARADDEARRQAAAQPGAGNTVMLDAGQGNQSLSAQIAELAGLATKPHDAP
jgi:hypothetical protein